MVLKKDDLSHKYPFTGSSQQFMKAKSMRFDG